MTRTLLAVVSMLLLFPAVAQESDPPGSGYAGMDGDVINYEYYDFGGFQLLMSEHRLKWRGCRIPDRSCIRGILPAASQ